MVPDDRKSFQRNQNNFRANEFCFPHNSVLVAEMNGTRKKTNKEISGTTKTKQNHCYFEFYRLPSTTTLNALMTASSF